MDASDRDVPDPEVPQTDKSDLDLSGRVSDLDSTLTALAELMARRRGGRLISCAETFTGGLLSRAMSAVDGAEEWFAGGIVVPRERERREVLGVSSSDPISEGSAVQMAIGVATLFRTGAAVAATGVGGPEPVGGRSPGTIVIGWVVDGQWGSDTLELPGTARETSLRAVRMALTSLSRAMTDVDDPRGGRVALQG